MSLDGQAAEAAARRLAVVVARALRGPGPQRAHTRLDARGLGPHREERLGRGRVVPQNALEGDAAFPRGPRVVVDDGDPYR